MNRFKAFSGAAAVLVLLSTPSPRALVWADNNVAATPRAHCGNGDRPETGLQGRVSAEDVSSGRAAQGFTCNTALVSHFGNVDWTGLLGGAGGYRVYRYVDPHGHICAYYDTTSVYPLNAPIQGSKGAGVYVLDMSDPAHPVKTANLVTPAMLSPHESLNLNAKRGLLAADMGYPAFNPGFVDIYDLTKDCRHPVLDSSSPLGLLGHEGTFSPDGNTFWVTSTVGHTFTAIDVSNPRAPKIVWETLAYVVHGLNVSNDGNTLYFGDFGPAYLADQGNAGLTILDVTQVQRRAPHPEVKQISHLSWPTVSVPQTAIPVTIGGKPYLVEVDEYARNLGAGIPGRPVGAARIIDIQDPKHPIVISNIRLEVHQQENVAAESGDPNALFPLLGYAAHYCSVPSRVDPGVVACSMLLSGLRVFNIRDPYHPKEIAYFNAPIPKTDLLGLPGSAAAYSAPAFDIARGDIWYSDQNSGFYDVHVSHSVWP